MVAATGVVIAWMLVKPLCRVFDPPPETLSWPLADLGVLAVMLAFSTWLSIWMAARASAVSRPGLLREVVGA